MLGQSIRSGTVSAVQESLTLAPADWHGFCLGFSTGHMGFSLVLREVEADKLDHDPIPVRQSAPSTIRDGFFRQIRFDGNQQRLTFAFFHEGAEKEHFLDRPKRITYERIRSDVKELRIDLEDGRTALIELQEAESPERLDVVNDKEPGC